MELEVWKDLPNYIGLYQVSNLGRVKSLDRVVKSRGICVQFIKGKILKQFTRHDDYWSVSLSKDSKQIGYRVHQLVAICFLNHKIDGWNIVVDHIDDNKKNNHVSNLQLLTHRQNTHRTQGKYSSQYKGVWWCKRSKIWIAAIRINKKLYNLGRFKDEHEAGMAYQKALIDYGFA